METGASRSTMGRRSRRALWCWQSATRNRKRWRAFARCRRAVHRQPVGRQCPRGGRGARANRRERAAGRDWPDHGRPGPFARCGRSPGQDRRFVAPRPGAARPRRFRSGAGRAGRVADGELARPVALAAEARREGRVARRDRQPAAAQPCAVAGLDGDQQRRFLRHARPWWDVHRHRIAPEVARRWRG